MKPMPRSLAGCSKNDTLGQRMRQSRTRCHLTIKDAAAQIGISAGQLGRIERGGVSMVAEPATLQRAARAYGVSDVWLYAGGHAGAKLVPEWYFVDEAAAA
jgi:transcriptional regulator with XRE-family HTH domain